jgi:IS5 family transposase
MERQISFSQSEFLSQKKRTRREKFLNEMETVVPWERLVALIQPVYPQGKRGRPPIGIERMLRIYFLQQWYGLADELLEETICDSVAMRIFVGIDLSVEAVPDATTLCHFRELLRVHHLGEAILAEINALLEERKLLLREGTIVDATIIAAPSSTKNATQSRDPQMHQTRKGNQWHFGMKAHVGVDRDSGTVHTVVGTAANEADINQAHRLLHGQEKEAYGDAGYTGVEGRTEVQAKHGEVQWHVAAKRGKLKAMSEGPLKVLYGQLEKLKASVRARVEHPFHVVKNLFKHRKVRYRGLGKNTHQLQVLFALANLLICRKRLAA